MDHVAFIYPGDLSQQFANKLSLLQNASAVATLGASVVVIAPRPNLEILSDEDYMRNECNFFGVDYNFEVRFIRSYSKLPKQIKLRLFALRATMLVRHLNKNKKWLIWSRDIYAAQYCIIFSMYVIYEHHTTATFRMQKILKKIVASRYFTSYVSISESHKNHLLDVNIPSKKIFVAHSGIDYSKVRQYVQQTPALPTNSICYAGSFYQGRGLDIIYEIAKFFPDVDVVVIGGSKFDFYKLISEVKELHNIHVVPRLERQELISMLSNQRFLIAPYTRSSSGIDGQVIAAYQSPLKIIEYLSLGKPVIATNVGAIGEIITHKWNGMLVESATSEAFCASISELLNNAELQSKIEWNAAESAKGYDWQLRTSNIIEFAKYNITDAG